MIIDVSKECNNKQIVIGRRGENNATIIQFEFSAWKREFGDGSLGLAARLPRNVEPYIVTLETEGTVSTWTVSSYDTQNNGQGAIQVVYIVDGVVKKSQVYRTYILDSIEGSVPTPPDPYESYIEQMMEIAADTYMNAQSAADSATNAAGSAGDAAGSARDASGYADNAAGSARDASGYANAASGSATAAETDALKAEGFAVGEQGGEAVGSGSPYYHNNAEYYSDQAGSSATSASGSATSAETNALKAEGYAVGKQNGTDVGDTSPYYHNNAEYYATEAAASARDADESAASAAQSASVFVIDPTLTHSGQAADAKVTGDELASVKSDLSEVRDIIAQTETTSTASQNYAVGDYLILNNQLYKVTVAISSGETITPGTNVELITLTSEVKSIKSSVDANASAIATLQTAPYDPMSMYLQFLRTYANGSVSSNGRTFAVDKNKITITATGSNTTYAYINLTGSELRTRTGTYVNMSLFENDFVKADWINSDDAVSSVIMSAIGSVSRDTTMINNHFVIVTRTYNGDDPSEATVTRKGILQFKTNGIIAEVLDDYLTGCTDFAIYYCAKRSAYAAGEVFWRMDCIPVLDAPTT